MITWIAFRFVKSEAFGAGMGGSSNPVLYREGSLLQNDSVLEKNYVIKTSAQFSKATKKKREETSGMVKTEVKAKDSRDSFHVLSAPTTPGCPTLK